jgi:phage/plasmid-like protein (TIGR03299 family)
MAHNLFQNRMAFVGQTPWHGLGTRVSGSVTAEEMCSKAGLDWNVYKRAAPGARRLDAKSMSYDRYLILREPVKPESAPVALGLVTSAYQPLQNTKAFAFFEPFIASGFASFHTAGALGKGERVWVLAKLKGQIVVERNDEVDRYLLLSNTHDGSGAVSVRFTPIRVVCQNTLNLAMKKGSGVISIRHTRHLTQHLANAQAHELTVIIDKVFDDAAKVFGEMARMRLSIKETEDFLNSLFPRTKTGREPDRWGRIRAIMDDTSVTPPATRDTIWGLYNAIVRDEDFRASREASAESRLARVWFGSGGDLKLRALALGRDLVGKAAA